MRKEVIPVTLAVDEKYLPYAQVTINSIVANSKSKFIDIIITHYNISQTAQEEFIRKNNNREGNYSVRFLDLKDAIDKTDLHKAKITERYPFEVVFRLIIPELLPEYDKIIYLDSDLIVREDIDNLYSIDIKDNWIAAALGVQFPIWIKEDESRLKWYESQGISTDYFNDGVLVINAKQFRNRHLLEALIEACTTAKYFPDQDALNIVCKGHVYFLGIEWNVGVEFCRRYRDDSDGEKFKIALEKGAILHYNSRRKPWKHPLMFMAEEWWKYAEEDVDYGNNEINLYYFKDFPNFGDALSFDLVRHLSGAKINYDYKKAEMMAAGSLFGYDFRFFGLENKPKEDAPPCHVWGSGFLEPNIPEGKLYYYRDFIVHAVRGKLTLDALIRAGIVEEHNEVALGDPGLLYVELAPECKTMKKEYDIALVPHRYDQVAALEVQKELKREGYTVEYVDVMLDKPLEVIRKIAAARKVISSSLHGLIVADSLGIPNKRVVFDDFNDCKQCQLSISHFKFADYYSAFGMDSPAYITEKELKEDPRGVIEKIGIQDVVPEEKVAKVKMQLLESFPISEKMRHIDRSEIVEKQEKTAYRGGLKVLMVCEPDFLNPFSQHIYNELLEYDLDADCNADNFWKCVPSQYDIIHIQFPEALFEWKVDNISQGQFKRLKDRIEELQNAGCKIFYTRHNEGVQIKRKGHIDDVYKYIEQSADGVIHMGTYSMRDCINKYRYSNARHYVVPHHTYPHLVRNYDRAMACEMFGLDPSKPVVLVFGTYRSEKEKQLVRSAFDGCDTEGAQLLAPTLERGKFISDKELPLYFAAADVVFIQRLRILNSGNLPLAFYYGKVVVGPYLGDVGEWLRITGNPVFYVFRPGSEGKALKKAFTLAKEGLGTKNQKYADENWNLRKVTEQIVKAYADVLNITAIPREGKRQYKRIDIGDAILYHHRLIQAENELCSLQKQSQQRLIQAENELCSLQKQISDLQKSYSFRIGRFITFVPRKVRGGVQCYRDHGAYYTLRRALYHMGLWKDEENG